MWKIIEEFHCKHAGYIHAVLTKVKKRKIDQARPQQIIVNYLEAGHL